MPPKPKKATGKAVSKETGNTPDCESESALEDILQAETDDQSLSPMEGSAAPGNTRGMTGGVAPSTAAMGPPTRGPQDQIRGPLIPDRGRGDPAITGHQRLSQPAACLWQFNHLLSS